VTDSAPSALGAAPHLTPRLRGVLHQYAFFVSLVLAVPLVIAAAGTREVVGAAVFAAGTAAMFGASALYLRGRWAPATRRRMRRLDHCGIFLMIAGSYTPFALLALDGTWRIAELAFVWSVVALAIAFRLVWVDSPGWITAALAVALGWAALFAAPEAYGTLGWSGLTLLLVSGVLYTVGAVVYSCRRPNPFPAVFGFHELFHVFNVAAVACQYALVAFWLLPES
jgi:hemolysin III